MFAWTVAGAMVAIAVVAAVFGSPLWTSLTIALLPRRLLPVAATGICSIQALLAYAVWWFFWGGGIGGEAHLSESWQWALGLALLPFAVSAFRWYRRSP